MTTDPANMNPTPPPDDTKSSDRNAFDAWLDQANASQRAARLNAPHSRALPPAHRAAIHAQQAVDASLNRLFSPPLHAPPLSLSGTKRSARAHFALHFARSKPLAAAACLAIASLAAFLIWQNWPESEPRFSGPPVTLQVRYQSEIQAGFSPYWVCRTRQELIGRFKSRFGTPLDLSDPPAGTSMAGMDYGNTISPKTVCILMHVDDAPVMAFVDLVANDRGQSPPSDPSLHQFSRTIGPYVVYEVTPLPVPRVLDLFSIPAG